jgi:hypothetical protein
MVEKELNNAGYFKLTQLQKLSDVAKIYNIERSLLDYRLKFLNEGVDYIKLGKRQPTILTPKGVEKLINVKGVEI